MYYCIKIAFGPFLLHLTFLLPLFRFLMLGIQSNFHWVYWSNWFSILDIVFISPNSQSVGIANFRQHISVLLMIICCHFHFDLSILFFVCARAFISALQPDLEEDAPLPLLIRFPGYTLFFSSWHTNRNCKKQVLKTAIFTKHLILNKNRSGLMNPHNR